MQTKYEHTLVRSEDLIRRQLEGESLGDKGWKVVASIPGGVLVMEREVR